MSIVSQEVAHILFHVNAENDAIDDSQIPGVQGRAGQVRAALAPLKNNNDDVTRAEFIDLIRNRARPPDTELLDEINAINPDDDGEKIRLALQSWVGKGPRPGRRIG